MFSFYQILYLTPGRVPLLVDNFIMTPRGSHKLILASVALVQGRSSCFSMRDATQAVGPTCEQSTSPPRDLPGFLKASCGRLRGRRAMQQYPNRVTRWRENPGWFPASFWRLRSLWAPRGLSLCGFQCLAPEWGSCACAPGNPPSACRQVR